MSRIYWDTMMFIYWLEDHPIHAERVKYIRERMIERNDVLCSSVLTLAELLTGAYKRDDMQAASAIRQVFHSGAIEVLSFTPGAAEIFAAIRAKHAISPPDAIHLACAGDAGTDIFLTNDDALVGKTVPGVQFVVRMDTNLF